MTYVIAEPCVDVKDKACIEECPVDCIYEGARMLYIHPDECVDCGACEPVCPVEAIYYEDDVPDQWSGYTQNNADFFAELGSPGGASKVGQTDNDPQRRRSMRKLGRRNGFKARDAFRHRWVSRSFESTTPCREHLAHQPSGRTCTTIRRPHSAQNRGASRPSWAVVGMTAPSTASAATCRWVTRSTRPCW
mgnify:CR=1 FL=1